MIIVKPGQTIEAEAVRAFLPWANRLLQDPAPRPLRGGLPNEAAAGKIEKFAMREAMIAELGLMQDLTA